MFPGKRSLFSGRLHRFHPSNGGGLDHEKFASLLLALVMCLCCLTTAALAERAPVAKDDLKIGFIFLHDENSTYDLNFITAAKAACEKLGIAYETKTNIPEGQECYDAAAELADAGCNIILRTLSVMNPT